jgi:hypothetical protein
MRIETRPTTFFSGTRAVFIGFFLSIPAVFLFLGFGSVAQRLWPEPSSAPACYWQDQAYVPRKDSIPLRGAPGRGGPSVDQRHDLAYHERLKQAESVCQPGACDAEAREQYRSALFWYLSSRLQHTRRLDMNFGDQGLRRAQEIYSTPADVRFEQGLRERYRAGVSRLNDIKQNRDAIAILVLKDSASLHPCRKAS